jgi:hypothetical protein
VMTPKHKTTREEKIAFALRLLDSDKAGEIVAAVYALKRLLQSMGTDWDGLARGFEKILNSNGGGAITQEEMRKAIDDAYAAGVQDTENKFHGANDFHNADGKPAWEAVALFLHVTKIGSRQSTINLSTTWLAAPSSGASRLRGSTSTFTVCFTNLAGSSHECAS